MFVGLYFCSEDYFWLYYFSWFLFSGVFMICFEEFGFCRFEEFFCLGIYIVFFPLYCWNFPFISVESLFSYWNSIFYSFIWKYLSLTVGFATFSALFSNLGIWGFWKLLPWLWGFRFVVGLFIYGNLFLLNFLLSSGLIFCSSFYYIALKISILSSYSSYLTLGTSNIISGFFSRLRFLFVLFAFSPKFVWFFLSSNYFYFRL